jgi:hypothetical protein
VSQFVARRRAVGVSLGDIDRGDRPLIVHQVLHLPGAPHAVQHDFPVVPFDGTQAPQGVVQSVGVKYVQNRQRFVIGLYLAQVG